MKVFIAMCVAVALVACIEARPRGNNPQRQRRQWNPNFWGQGQDGGDQQEGGEQQFEEEGDALERQQEMQEQEREQYEQQDQPEQQEQPEQAEASDGQWFGNWYNQQWYQQQQWPNYNRQRPNMQQQRPDSNLEAMELQEQMDQQDAMDLQEPQAQTAVGGNTSEESNEDVEGDGSSLPSNSQLSAGPFSSI